MLSSAAEVLVVKLGAFLPVCFLALACSSAPQPVLEPSPEPSRAAVEADGIVRATLMPPRGEWVTRELKIENAKLVDRLGDAPLVLTLERSGAKMGETTVEGADEPIRVTVTYADRKAGVTADVVYSVDAASGAKEGSEAPVTVQW